MDAVAFVQNNLSYLKLDGEAKPDCSGQLSSCLAILTARRTAPHCLSEPLLSNRIIRGSCCEYAVSLVAKP
jgi:hypothetical protein